ncbi:carboxypeptidase-like regulatory domain-containing protein [bacterium]|nr:carboxypeptidase-like regulatory domain-containing protein [bacterium]
MSRFINRIAMRWAVLLLAACPLWAPRSFCATTGKIAGRVTDAQTGDPLSGANVLVVGTALGAACDGDGRYFIINVPPGVYDIRVSMMGYATLTKTGVEVMVNRTQDIHFNLNPAVLEGQEVIVVAERPLVEMDVTGSEMVVNAAALARTPITEMEDVVRQQRGIFYTGTVTYIRGGIGSEVAYNMDGNSMTGGVLSDSWKGINTTAIQEVSVMTGGYNAEYGNAMSGVVNVVTKEARSDRINLSGTLKYRYRPAGQYHWGRNMFDQTLKKYTDFDLAYWESTLAKRPEMGANYFRSYYGWPEGRTPTVEEVHQAFLHQADGNKILTDYVNRPDQEVEGTFFGSFARNTNFLLSGNYKKAVSIYPTLEPYQPEYNVQAKFNWLISPSIKLSYNLVSGWYKNSAFRPDNTATSREMGTAGGGAVPNWMLDPYMGGGYWSMWGSTYGRGTTRYNIGVHTLKWQHTLSPSTFYTLNLNVYRDRMYIIPDYSHERLPAAKIDESWGWQSLNNAFSLGGGSPYPSNVLRSQSLSFGGDLTSQLHRAHQIKSGAVLKLNDMDYESIDVAHSGIDNCIVTTNIWKGSPLETAFYLQDKIEYSGITLNLGVRVDGFDTRRKFPENPVFDPLGQTAASGSDGQMPTNSADLWFLNRDLPDYAHFYTYDSLMAGLDQAGLSRDAWIPSMLRDRNTLSSEWKWAIAPRIGVSFPVTASSKIRFSYGHFYQRPAWTKFYGAPFQFTLPYNKKTPDPLADAAVIFQTIHPVGGMYWGQPGLTFEKAIQYEFGYDQDIFDVVRLNLTAYYKDQTRLTRFSNRPLLDYGQAHQFAAGGGISQTGFAGEDIAMEVVPDLQRMGSGYVYLFANDMYKDTRGLELNVERLFNNRWSASVTFDYGLSSGAKYGFQSLSANPEVQSLMAFANQDGETKLRWLSSYKLKANFSLVTPKKFLIAMGDLSLGLYYEYFAGDQYTYYAVDYTGVRYPDNRRWYPHQRTDLKISKRIKFRDMNTVLGVDVINLFNNYDRYLLSGQDLQNWEEQEQIPLLTQSGEPHVWHFYSSLSNPKRMFYFTVALEF